MLIAVEILIEFSLVREERYNFMQFLNIFRSVFILPAVDCNTAFMDWDETDDRIEQRRLSGPDRKSTRLNSSHVASSYAVFCFNKKNRHRTVSRVPPNYARTAVPGRVSP